MTPIRNRRDARRTALPLLALLLAVMSSLYGQSNRLFYTVPYTYYTDVSGAFAKEYSVGGGAYTYVGIGRHSVEFDAAYSRIHWAEQTLTDPVFGPYTLAALDFDQVDLTSIYTNYQITNIQFRIGGHAIFSNDAFTDGTLTALAGLKRVRPNEYSAAVDVYQTFYSNYAPEFSALQVDGTFGFYFGNAFTYGQLYAETRGSYIRLSEPVGFEETQFPSIQQTLRFSRNGVALEAFWWGGYRAFAVDNGGTVVFNLPERHLGAFGASMWWGFHERASLKVAWRQGRFKELGGEAVATGNTVSLTGGWTW